jgi:hypothetical protein
MEGGENNMRKSSFFIIMLLVGVVAFTVTPAFAEYNQSDVMLDQADNTVFGMGDMTDEGDGPGNSVGLLADENPSYGPGTIYIPYHSSYGFPGCGTVNGGVISEDLGIPQSDSYGCAEDEGGIDAGLILQDLFAQVNEGNTAKEAGAQGIAQYLDSLFAYRGDIGNVEADTLGDDDQGNVFINQTLDQDLADMTAASNQYGIWQRLHVAFTHTENAEVPSAAMHYDHDGIDQTMISFLSEESGPGVDVEPGVVISYLAQWFQMGENQTCAEGESNMGLDAGSLCTHTEFGGHGTAFAGTTGTQINTASHDP